MTSDRFLERLQLTIHFRCGPLCSSDVRSVSLMDTDGIKQQEKVMK